ncbi:IS66 family insertion sequence element accessory protein TnpB [Streptococcus sp. ZJ100]
MTIRLSDLGQVYLVCGKTDMRQGIDSLAYLVKSQFNLDPFSGQVYLFCGGRKDRFKALYWDGQGFCFISDLKTANSIGQVMKMKSKP